MIYTVNSSKNCVEVALFRAYLRRKPSGLLLVTVLSTLLPRPLFRMYPAELGEAAAVERSVGHALCALHQRTQNESQQRNHPCLEAVFTGCDKAAKNYPDDRNRDHHALLPAVNVVATEPLQSALPCGPQHEHSHADKREEQHAAECNGEFKKLGCGDEFEHCSQPPNFYDQIGSDKNQEAHQNESETSNAKTVGKRNEPIRHGSPPLTDKMYRPKNGRCGKECRNMPAKGLFSACVGQSHCNDSCQKKNSVEANEHDSPHGLHQPRQYAEISDEQQAGADGYAVKGGHGSVLERVKVVEERAEPQPNIDAYNPLVIDCRPQNPGSEHCASKSTSPVPAPQPTQHLRLRVVWQGLL